MPLGWHLRDFKSENESGLLLNGQSDRQGLAFGMFKRFHIVELDFVDLFSLSKVRYPAMGLNTQEGLFSRNSLAIKFKSSSAFTHRNIGHKKPSHHDVDPAFFLAKTRVAGGG
jgi:hypothetical protein